MPGGREGAVLANVIFFGKHMLAVFSLLLLPADCYGWAAPAHPCACTQQPRTGEGLSRKLKQTHPGSYQRQRQFANPNPPIPSGWLCLHSNTISLCLLNLGIGLQSQCHIQLSCSNCLSPQNTKFYTEPQGEGDEAKLFCLLAGTGQGQASGQLPGGRRCSEAWLWVAIVPATNRAVMYATGCLERLQVGCVFQGRRNPCQICTGVSCQQQSSWWLQRRKAQVQ